MAPPERAFDGAPEGQELAQAPALERGQEKGLRSSCKLLILRQARAQRRQAQAREGRNPAQHKRERSGLCLGGRSGRARQIRAQEEGEVKRP